MSPETPQHPMHAIPVAGRAPDLSPSRHETILPSATDEDIAQLAAAVAEVEEMSRHNALRRVVAEHPGLLEGWARLSELSLARGDAAEAYAFARVAYHRGLDGLRRNGWGGTGVVRWAQPSNRGFLRGLHALFAVAVAIGEEDEALRCREFLIELDPEDTLGIAAYPETPGRTWTPPSLPD